MPRGLDIRRLVITVFVLVLHSTQVTAQMFITTDFPRSPRPEASTEAQSHSYLGMWVTQDGHIRHELLGNGRYVEARGQREAAFEGRYRVTGNIIQYWDDTGFYADGQFREDTILDHAGFVLLREE
jgi:hypothetical protein